MNTDNIWIVILILAAVLIGANALMYAAVRGSRGMHFNWLKDMSKGFRQPWQKEDDSLSELSEQVRKLKETQSKADESKQ